MASKGHPVLWWLVYSVHSNHNMAGAAHGRGLCGGRFSGATDELMERFNESLSFDRRFFSADIDGSKAYASALAKSGIITAGSWSMRERYGWPCPCFPFADHADVDGGIAAQRKHRRCATGSSRWQPSGKPTSSRCVAITAGPSFRCLRRHRLAATSNR